MIIGQFGIVGVATLSFVSSTSSTTGTITLPTGILAGDLIFVWDASLAFVGLPADTALPGFTRIAMTTGAQTRGSGYYKIGVPADSGAVLTGFNGLTQGKVAFLFRGDVPIALVTPSSVDIEASDVVPANQTVAIAARPVVIVAGHMSSNTVDRTMAPAADGVVLASATYVAAYKIYNGAPASVTVTQADAGVNILFSCALSVA